MGHQEERDGKEAGMGNFRSDVPGLDRVLPLPPPSTSQQTWRDSTIAARDHVIPRRLSSFIWKSPSLSSSKSPTDRFRDFPCRQGRQKYRNTHCRFYLYACPRGGEFFGFMPCQYHPRDESSVAMTMEQAARPF